MHRRFADEGLSILSLTPDAKAPVEAHARRLRMDYPLGVGSQTERDYGITSIPHAYLIGPDGAVIWQGNPASLQESQIEEALHRIERFPVPENLHASLSDAREELVQRDYAGALRLIDRVATGRDETAASAARELRQAMEEYARGKLDEAVAHHTAGRLRSAHAGLTQVSESFPGLAAGEEATAALRELTREAAFRDENSAIRLLEKADDLIAQGKGREAAPVYDQILERYPETETAGIVRQRLGR